MRHGDIQTTMNVYSHVELDDTARAIEQRPNPDHVQKEMERDGGDRHSEPDPCTHQCAEDACAKAHDVSSPRAEEQAEAAEATPPKSSDHSDLRSVSQEDSAECAEVKMVGATGFEPATS